MPYKVIGPGTANEANIEDRLNKLEEQGYRLAGQIQGRNGETVFLILYTDQVVEDPADQYAWDFGSDGTEQ